MNISTLVISVVVVVVIFAFLSVRERNRQKEMKANRTGYTPEIFINHFVSADIPDNLSMTIYLYLQNLLSESDFPVYPSDDLAEVYGIGKFGGVGLDEVVHDLCRELNCISPEDAEFSDQVEFNNTVEGLVKYLHFLCSKKIK